MYFVVKRSKLAISAIFALIAAVIGVIKLII